MNCIASSSLVLSSETFKFNGISFLSGPVSHPLFVSIDLLAVKYSGIVIHNNILHTKNTVKNILKNDNID
jgi:hypothetical protein